MVELKRELLYSVHNKKTLGFPNDRLIYLSLAGYHTI